MNGDVSLRLTLSRQENGAMEGKLLVQKNAHDEVEGRGDVRCRQIKAGWWQKGRNEWTWTGRVDGLAESSG